ncbi:MAG: hypothetical protein ACUVWP_02080 [bacterium]
MRFLYIFILLVIVFFEVFAGDRYIPYGEDRVIDSPTAWTKGKGEYEIYLRFLPFIIGGEIGMSDFLTLGISYGGSNVIGYGKPNWNPRPGFLVKAQITQGGAIIPAIAFGYDDQGWGPYYEYNPIILEKGGTKEAYNRYQYKSKGFFLVFSQEFKFLGVTSIHFGLNYAITERKDDKTLNMYLALEKSITPDIYFLAEYDPGFNDNNILSLGECKGFLDIGARWKVSKEFSLEVYASNIFKNQQIKLKDAGSWYRSIFISYETFF